MVFGRLLGVKEVVAFVCAAFVPQTYDRAT
jgi:hypothetical protein